MNVDKIKAFNNVNIIGSHNFVVPSPSSIYKQMDHGTKVLSTMAMNQPNIFVGTAPDAGYLLLRSEDYGSENIVEEDYWAEAAEFADSVGVDIISSSLSYHHFDDPFVNHYYYEQDGVTALISRRHLCWQPRVSSVSTVPETTAWAHGRKSDFPQTHATYLP